MGQAVVISKPAGRLSRSVCLAAAAAASSGSGRGSGRAGAVWDVGRVAGGGDPRMVLRSRAACEVAASTAARRGDDDDGGGGGR